MGRSLLVRERVFGMSPFANAFAGGVCTASRASVCIVGWVPTLRSTAPLCNKTVNFERHVTKDKCKSLVVKPCCTGSTSHVCMATLRNTQMRLW